MDATDTEAAAPAAAARKKKPNSPKAPGLPLRGAMGEVAKIYDRYSHSTFTRGEMASALNMSSGSGAFYGKAATLGLYGLIEDTGGHVKVSSLFKALYQAPEGSPEMKRNALAAVSKPSVFANLLKQFGSRIPDEAAIALRLEMQGGFNRDRAQEVALAFRSSLADYGLIDGNGNVLSVRDEPVVDAPADARGDDDQVSDDNEDMGRATGRQRLEVALRDGRKAVLNLPDDLTVADTRKISALLNALAADYDG